MSRFAEPMARLIEELKKLPGVGAKSAQRLAFHILRADDGDAAALADAIRDVKAKLHLCSVCNNITDVDPCVYCASATRNQRLVCVVEEPTNIASIEKTRHYNGVYHVLHGPLSPLHGVGPGHLRLSTLTKRIDPGAVEDAVAWRAVPAGSLARQSAAGVRAISAQDVEEHADVAQARHVIVVIARDALQRIQTSLLRRHALAHVFHDGVRARDLDVF